MKVLIAGVVAVSLVFVALAVRVPAPAESPAEVAVLAGIDARLQARVGRLARK